MIINGGARSGAKSLATHLLNQTKNEHVQVLDVRGCLATDLQGALVEMEESAEATRCLRPLYHANIDPDRKVKMTAEQWQRSIDALEGKLGLTDHPRAVVMHQKNGREHIHVVWNRIDLESMKTVRDSHNYRKHELTARELEREFGHERVQGAHIDREDRPRPERTPPKWAMQQGERLKLDPRQVETHVRELWASSDNGRSFAAALKENGYILAKGDRRDFMVIDPAGGRHSLGRLTDTKAVALRARMNDVNRDALPSVEQAVAALGERKATTEQAAKREAVGKEFGAASGITKRAERITPSSLPRPQEKQPDDTTIDIRVAYRVNRSAPSFAEYLKNRGIHLAAVTAKEAAGNPDYRLGQIVAVNSAGQVYALDRHTTGDDRAKVEKILDGLDRKKLQGIEATQQEINLRAERFIAGSRIGLLKRTEPERRTSLPSAESGSRREKIDIKRYITDSDYRRDVHKQQEKEPQTPDRERGSGELER